MRSLLALLFAVPLLLGAPALVVIGDEVCWELGRGLDAARLAAALERHGLPFAPLRLGRGAVDEAKS